MPTYHFAPTPAGGGVYTVEMSPMEMQAIWREWVDAHPVPHHPATRRMHEPVPTRLPCDVYCDHPACVAARQKEA